MPTTLQSYYRKFRMWGFRGILTFFANHRKNARLIRLFHQGAKRNPQQPVKGLTLIADFSGNTSACKTMRDFRTALEKVGIPNQCFDLSNPDNNPGFQPLRFDHAIEMTDSPFPDFQGVEKSRLMFWEFESGFTECHPHVKDGHPLVAMSDFNVKIFQKALPSTKIKKILYPFLFNAGELLPIPEIRKKYGISETDFMVFYNFDYGSSFKRKNPDGALRAFAQAFENTPSSKLVFKTMRGKAYPSAAEKLNALARRLNISDRFITIDDYIPQRDIYSLTNACDAYISLHRGEGFGLGIAEAMSFGKPVVITDYSAPTEFCNSNNSLPVPFKLVTVSPEQIDHPYFKDVIAWAEPDISAAAKALRNLYDNPGLGHAIGDNAKKFMAEHFSPANFNASIEEFLA